MAAHTSGAKVNNILVEGISTMSGHLMNMDSVKSGLWKVRSCG